MEHSTIQESAAVRRKVNRSAYKGHATRWKIAAFILLTAWAFTTGALIYTLRRIEIIKVIQPTAQEAGKKSFDMSQKKLVN